MTQTARLNVGHQAERNPLATAITIGQDFRDQSDSLLEACKLALVHDEKMLTFDILGLHRTCAKLLKDIQTFCLKNARKGCPRDVYGGDGNLNAVVVQVLRDIGGCEREGKGESVVGGLVEVLALTTTEQR
jgi:hypothetical protein